MLSSYLFYVTLSFLYNIICYLISAFAFSLVTLSEATTVPGCHGVSSNMRPRRPGSPSTCAGTVLAKGCKAWARADNHDEPIETK